MKTDNRAALKEWAAVERALGEGRVALVLRKGGIWERRGGFEVEHREFWLFPTLYHQNAGELAERLRDEAAPHPRLAAAAPDDPVHITCYARVEEALRIERAEVLERLTGLHPLSPDAALGRFHYRGRPVLHALLLRIHALAEPHRVVNTAEYEGCVSWVELHAALPTAGVQPVLDDASFATLRDEVLARAGSEGVTRL